MSYYRDQIHTKSVFAEPSDVEKETEFMLVDDVSEILDSIESAVQDIVDILEPIEGLTEIDSAKDLVKSLDDKLY